jgi:hypothetical protein
VFFPASELMLMICPVRRRIISGATARQSRNTDLRLVSRTASQSASGNSWKGPNKPIPALFTRISMEPNFCWVFVPVGARNVSLQRQRLNSFAVERRRRLP